MLHPVILAGGVGTRLWPVSRQSLPKQFADFAAGQSLFGTALDRLGSLENPGPVCVICHSDHRFLVAEQLKRLHLFGDKSGSILLEPVSRNTAPAIALAAMAVHVQDADACLLVMPADHLIEDKAAFRQSVTAGFQLAQRQSLVTFGVRPGRPETGYGYIKRGARHKSGKGYEVVQFVEKPELSMAQAYLESGDYYWNSGIFMFRADTYLSELKRLAHDMFADCESAFSALGRDADFLWIPHRQFAACRSESIDHAVMEKTNDATMVPLEAGWSDLGAWDSVWEQGEKDGQGNVIAGDVIQLGVHNSYLNARSRLLAVLGLSNAVVVETRDAVLVADRRQAQQVKALVQQLGELRRREIDHHSLMYRPWGTLEHIARGVGYQVRHMVVNPGAAISLQRHPNRCAHWTVIKGRVQLHIDGKELCLEENQSTSVPQGSGHRLSNSGTIPAEIIEVQVGDYPSEDDIENHEDQIAR